MPVVQRVLLAVGILAMLLPHTSAGAIPAWTTEPGVFAETEPDADERRQGADDASVTVMTRNLYLGADVGVALELLPDLSAAAQFMWDQVRLTTNDTRMRALAAEVERTRPDVIGLQEAARWSCRGGFSGEVIVLDLLALYLEALQDAGTPYVVAEAGGDRAENPGYAIPAIPFATTVTDPDTFQPLFEQDSVACGFSLSDVLLVREDLAGSVVAAGTSEFTTRYAVVPVVFTIDRGYAWADVALAGTTVRFVTVHAESLFDEGKVPPSAEQARQLREDLEETTVPVVVMGDLNAERRDPRGADDPNPAGQPAAGGACAAQVPDPTVQTALTECNGYWSLRAGGLADAGPPQRARNLTFGGNSLLAGPDLDRLPVALQQGNDAGFTDRIDHVLVGNGAVGESARTVGGRWPDGPDVWTCDSPQQRQATRDAARLLRDAGALAGPLPRTGVCLPSDHAGVVATVDVSAGPSGVVQDPALPTRSSLRIDLLGWLSVAAILLLAVIGLIMVFSGMLVSRWRRRRARRQSEQLAGTDSPGRTDTPGPE
jgi:endonuclease/exonuclease/phosphatase family metal-dependent hydrolase